MSSSLDWRNPRSPRFAEPSNHRLVPGGTEYGRYLWVRGHIAPGARVLDVGCNCGQLAVNLVQDLGCRVTGVDIVPEFVEHCRTEKADFGRFLCADFGAMGPAEVEALGQFDVVTALEVIEHEMDLRRFRENVRLALRPGGKLIVTTPHPAGLMGYAAMRERANHVRMRTPWRLERAFGPMVDCAEIRRDQCGRLLSIGAVFVRGDKRMTTRYTPGGYTSGGREVLLKRIIEPSILEAVDSYSYEAYGILLNEITQHRSPHAVPQRG